MSSRLACSRSQLRDQGGFVYSLRACPHRRPTRQNEEMSKPQMEIARLTEDDIPDAITTIQEAFLSTIVQLTLHAAADTEETILLRRGFTTGPNSQTRGIASR